MDSGKIQEIAFEIILNSGESRTFIHEAFNLMREKEFSQANGKINEANDSLMKAHKAQTDLISQYAGGEKIEMEMILVHAQDHLMTTMTLKEVALELLFLYQHMT